MNAKRYPDCGSYPMPLQGKFELHLSYPYDYSQNQRLWWHMSVLYLYTDHIMEYVK